MPTQRAFDAVPAFPADISTFTLPQFSYVKLMENDEAQSREMFDTFCKYGFALLDFSESAKGQHILEQAEHMFELTKEITIGLPFEEKMKFEASPQNVFGYSKIGKTKTEDGRPDRFECFAVHNDEVLGNVPPRPAPEPIARNRSAIRSYLEDIHSVSELILNQLDDHLQLPKGTLASFQRIDRVSKSQLRMLRCPPQPEGDRRTAFLGHTDLGTITILFNIVGGLQILPPGKEAKDENWMYIKPVPGCAIINLGDALVEWTGGVLRSNLHRVYFAPGEQATCDRYSLAYAARPTGLLPMYRLQVPGSLIPALEPGEDEVRCSADEWAGMKSAGLIAGKDIGRSRGGRLVAAY